MMSKELEALNYLVNLAVVGNKEKHRGKIFESEEIVIKAIKRNEPMKVIFTRITDVLTENFWDEPTCPKCKSLVIDEDEFCRECGQALEKIEKGEYHE